VAYKRITYMEITEIMRRYFDCQAIRSISRQSGMDRKTMRKYINEILKRGITSYDKEKIESILPEIIPAITGRPARSRNLLEPFKDEISELITAKGNKLKPKSAFEVITERHGLSEQVSYSSYKRFMRENKFVMDIAESTCRLEYEPGEQVQIDYGKMGTLYDPITKANHAVYAFIGSLAGSRHKFVEFVFKQDQQSFTQSHVRMFNFFGGTPKVIYLDNLKTGVIKPDLYNPVINKSYAELAEYYECFLNPCRVATPKDKPIVERDVQTVREQFKIYKALNNKITIAEANRSVINWLVNIYGQHPHGTTRLKPYEEFIRVEQPLLLPLPLETFEAALWKEATVHPDHFIQVQNKTYSIPHPYLGKRVWVKVTHNIIEVYYNDQLIKIHPIPKGYRQTDLNDFPENMQGAMDTKLIYAARKSAEEIGSEFGELITKILAPHAYINTRKALGILHVAGKYPKEIIAMASQAVLNDYHRLSPKLFTSIIEKLSKPIEEEAIIISTETSCFVRDMDYFINSNLN
jgi:transposase